MGNSSDVSSETLLTIAKAAKLLGVSTDDVRELLLDPELPRMQFRHGRSVRLPQQALLDYVKQRSRDWFDYC
ncbi:helix-turn-helix domain-containing protein [Levilactobacillus parabrevis]|uniref:helix-turn-helix domain-containing protein n=1 Tax=Levilactobacillus parabrevis TaxID=357278 RepID=UPI0009DB3D18